jgi:hypothetical protein
MMGKDTKGKLRIFEVRNCDKPYETWFYVETDIPRDQMQGYSQRVKAKVDNYNTDDLRAYFKKKAKERGKILKIIELNLPKSVACVTF